MLLFYLFAEHSGIAFTTMDTRSGDTEYKIYRTMSAMTWNDVLNQLNGFGKVSTNIYHFVAKKCTLLPTDSENVIWG